MKKENGKFKFKRTKKERQEITDGKEKKIGAAEPILTPIDILDGPYSAISTPILPIMLKSNHVRTRKFHIRKLIGNFPQESMQLLTGDIKIKIDVL